MVRFYPGVDGLKTGYTSEAGFCITTTAKKNNMRLITVVMGEPTSAVRNSETTKMLDYGFNTYKIDTILPKSKVLAKSKVNGGNDKLVNIVPMEDVNIMNTKVGTKRNVTYEFDFDDISAPVKKGDVVGKINVIEDGKIIMKIDATVDKNVDRASIVTIFGRTILDIISGNI